MIRSIILVHLSLRVAASTPETFKPAGLNIKALVNTVDWRSLPGNFDVRVLSSIEFCNSIPKAFGASFKCMPDKETSVDHLRTALNYGKIKNRNWNVATIVALTDNSLMNLTEVFGILNDRRRCQRLTLIMVETDLDENYRRFQNAASKTVAKFSIRSQVYMVKIDTSPDPNTTLKKKTKLGTTRQIIGIYGIKSALKVESVQDPFDKLSIAELLSNGVTRKFDLESLVAAAENNPSIQYDVEFKTNASTTHFKSGAYVKIFRDLKIMMNFTEKAVVGGPTGQDQSGKVTGITFELLESEEADLCIQTITITDIRAKWLEFLQPMSKEDGVWAFFIQPPLYTLRNIFLTPFKPALWIAFLILYIVVTALITCFSYIHCRNKAFRIEEEQERLMDIDSRFMNDGYLWALSAACQKGWSRTPKASSMRIIFFIGCSVALLAHSQYSATIVSVLSVKVVPVNKFEDLFMYNFKLYVYETSTIMQNLLKNIINIYNLQQGIELTDYANEVKRLKRGRNAFLSYQNIFYSGAIELNETEVYLCDIIQAVQAPIYAGKTAMFVKKGSDFRNVLNYRLMMIREFGLSSRYIARASRQARPACHKDDKAHLLKLGLFDVLTAYLSLGGGYSAALSFLVLEILWHRRRIPADVNK